MLSYERNQIFELLKVTNEIVVRTGLLENKEENVKFPC